MIEINRSGGPESRRFPEIRQPVMQVLTVPLCVKQGKLVGLRARAERLLSIF